MNDSSRNQGSPSSEASGESFRTAKDASSPIDSVVFSEGAFSRLLKAESKDGLGVDMPEKANESDEDRASPTSVAVDLARAALKETVERKDDDTKTQDDDTRRNGASDVSLLEYKQQIEALKQQLDQANRDKDDLQQQVQMAQAQRAKTIANLKNKKGLLAQATEKNRDLQTRLERAHTQQKELDEEMASLRLGLQKVSANRDDLKNKLRTKQEIVKCVRQEKDEVVKRLQKMEQEREMERELLNQYRSLAHYTGYYGYGKQIRALEANLASSLEE